MTVEELIKALSKYPKNTKVYTDNIGMNFCGELILTHKKTSKEKQMYEEIKQRDREREAHRGEITCFAERW